VKGRGYGIPKGRGYHSSALVGKSMYIWGGSDGKACFNDMNFFDTSSHIWYTVKCQEDGLLAHATATFGNYIVMFGGHDSNNFENTCKIFDIRVNKWFIPVQYGTRPPSRAYHTLSLCDHRLWSIGGFDSTSSSSEIYKVDLGHYACQEFTDVQQRITRLSSHSALV